MRKNGIPERLGSAREFKARKRWELAELERAACVVQSGCAFTPMAREMDGLLRTIREWRRIASAKEWGR